MCEMICNKELRELIKISYPDKEVSKIETVEMTDGEMLNFIRINSADGTGATDKKIAFFGKLNVFTATPFVAKRVFLFKYKAGSVGTIIKLFGLQLYSEPPAAGFNQLYPSGQEIEFNTLFTFTNSDAIYPASYIFIGKKITFTTDLG